MRAYAYNNDSMRKYQWGPEDLGLPSYASDKEVYDAVIELQKNTESLDVDGFVGPQTVRYVLALKADRLDDESTDTMGFLLVGGQIVEVPFRARPASPTGDMSLIQFNDYRKRSHNPTQVVWHWDVTYSAKTCRRILANRGYSSHGCIDNDGMFYQFLDFADHAAWHAGKRAVNSASIGIDVCNVVNYSDTRAKWYAKRFGPRPTIDNAVVNGWKPKKFFGYYPAQIETAKDIAEFCYSQFGIELATPDEARVISDPEDFKGHIAHYHITKNKWDVAGFPFDYVIGESTSYE